MSDKPDKSPIHHSSRPTILSLSKDTHHDANRDELRAHMRAKRNSLPLATRKFAALKVATALLRARVLRKDQRVAVYAAFDGEIDLTPVIRYARRMRCVVYAPRIVDMRSRSMEFVAMPRHADAFMQSKGDRASILKPVRPIRRKIDPRRLDTVLVPLVAFDMQGWRLGFGAGFYDRKFDFLRRLRRRKPTLIGIAYDFQCVPQQHRESWDVLLDGVATESGFRRCRPLSIDQNRMSP